VGDTKRSASVKFTYEDFVTFPDDGKRHEIIDGEHYVTPSPNTRHQRISTRFAGFLTAYLREHPIGEVFVAPFDVVLSDVDVVEPDLLYLSRSRAGFLTELHVRGAPDLAVEILSPGTRKVDEDTKRRLYERFDVLEYWLVDPELEGIKIYRRDGGAFVLAAELSAGQEDMLSTPLLPGFSLHLAEIFAPPF